MKIRPFGLRITARAEVPELLRDTRPFPIAWRRALPEETGPGFTYPLFPDPSPGRPGPPPKEGRKPLPPERPGADPDPTPPPDESGDDEGTVPGDAPLEPVPGDSRRYKDIPAGPYDPRRPLPWDKYEYPATPPPPRMPLAQRLEKKAAEYYLKWWLVIKNTFNKYYVLIR